MNSNHLDDRILLVLLKKNHIFLFVVIKRRGISALLLWDLWTRSMECIWLNCGLNWLNNEVDSANVS